MINNKELLSENQQTILNRLQEFADNQLEGAVKEYHISKNLPLPLLSKIFSMEFFHLLIDEEPLSILTFLEGLRIIAKQFPSLASLMITQAAFAILPIHLFGTDRQKSDNLLDLVTGKSYAAFALSEEFSGSNIDQIKTLARKVDDGWLLQGSKKFVSHGNFAEYVFVVAKMVKGDQDDSEEIGIFKVEANQSGLTISEPIEKSGLKALPVVRMTFDQVKVQADDILGQGIDGKLAVATVMNYMKIAIAVQSLGLAQGTFELGLFQMKRRRRFGKRLIDSIDIQHKLADLYTKMRSIDAYVNETLMSQKLDSVQIASAKLLASEMSLRITGDLIHLAGGSEYMQGTELDIYHQDAQWITKYGGSSDSQRKIISQEWL